mmetsp:Transcript_106770/g.189770  ORF Transcript_106770/g.189770 Transcript_106770/m.189770 type:complete len:160 (+) Transcript_106770:55-534(+)
MLGWFLGLFLNPISFALVTFYAPLMSVKALKAKQDETRWISFWLTWSMLSTFDAVTFGALELIPFWSVLRCALLVYLLFYGGAQKAFDKGIEPLYEMAVLKVPGEHMKMIESIEKDPQAFAMELYKKVTELAQTGLAAGKAKYEDVKKKSEEKGKGKKK